MKKIEKSDAEWKKLLNEKQYEITTRKGTEFPGTCTFDQIHEAGIFQCVRCGTDLFHSLINIQFWAIAVIIVGIGITLSVLFTRKDIFYCLVVDWSLLGILLKRLADSTPVPSVIVITIVGLVLISAGIIGQIVRRRVY